MMFLPGVTALLVLGALQAANVQRTSARGRFIGVWNVVSVESTAKNGTVTRPHGDHPVGRITYDEQGRMSALVMRAGRNRISAPSLELAPEGELREAVSGFVAYCGTYDVDEATRTVTHHVQLSLNPNQTGTDLRRTYEFQGNRLILTAVTEQAVQRITWQRATE